ncbi:hypothetical protein Sinac_6823 [Singulisphaera acidiphila DSM 18658]|uniref:Uncharacterized protein n=1 Tax=Singulisphaera acidiphila (strain ATCC BAA-1392 / DSM 18658 / VKM B-2454 / MOB10) TaxID=886293 RepID=L0DNS0_SINAD|nr:hypothetical protein Sinac_6823 [Singulisphaera acidiphila DSM 18658]
MFPKRVIQQSGPGRGQSHASVYHGTERPKHPFLNDLYPKTPKSTPVRNAGSHALHSL